MLSDPTLLIYLASMAILVLAIAGTTHALEHHQ